MKKTPGLLLAVAALAAGCGADENRTTDRAAATTPQAVLELYRAAVIDGDGATACGVLSADAMAIAEDGGSDCAARFAAVGDLNTSEDVAAMEAMRPKAEVDGSQAVARFRTLGGDPTRIVLVEDDEGWKVSESPELHNFELSNG